LTMNEVLFTKRSEGDGDGGDEVPFPSGNRFSPVLDESRNPVCIEGGMGVVFRAHDTKLDLPVAIKRIRSQIIRQSDALGRFLSEARAQVRLNHPHIVRLYSLDEDPYGPYLVLDWVDGESLYDHVQRQGVLSASSALELLIPIADALHYGHRQGLIHRDVKPANILVRTADQIPLLTDFGLVRSSAIPLISQQYTMGGDRLGTQQYMSPEQCADASSVDHRTDIFALGVTLYWLCTGRTRPSWGETPPQDLQQLMIRSMAESPADRYADMGEFSAAMRAVLASAESSTPAADAVSPRVSGSAAVDPSATTIRTGGDGSSSGLGQHIRKVREEIELLHESARQLELEHCYAEAVAALEQIDSDFEHLRDAELYDRLVSRRDRVLELEAQILPSARRLQFSGLRALVEELLELQPGRGDMVDLLSELPAEPVAPPAPRVLVSPFSAAEALSSQQSLSSSLGREVELTNGIGMKFRLIPPGTFLMGSPEDEEDRDEDEYQHEVRLTRAFYLGVYPVTQAEWTSVMGSNPSWFSSSGDGSDEVSGQDTSHFPVEQVSWDDAQEFLGKLNASHGMSGVRYRLPSEAEWEYACRAGTISPFSFGNVLNGDKANCDGDFPYGTSSTGPDLGRTSVVGSYGANGFGLSDMHGNVDEWCQDWYGGDYYSSSPSEDPAGPSSGSSRVLRGGSWLYSANFCRSAYRNHGAPAYSDHDHGFRVLCELS
jgi:formylglycine-generating enzyme required for sulfatase activity